MVVSLLLIVVLFLGMVAGYLICRIFDSGSYEKARIEGYRQCKEDMLRRYGQ